METTLSRGTALSNPTPKGQNEAGINMEMISMESSKNNLTFVVKDEDANPARRALHETIVSTAKDSVLHLAARQNFR